MSIIDNIQSWVAGWHLERFIKQLFKSAQKLWEAIHPTVQEIIKQSSAVVALITTAEGMTPQFVFDKITEILPFFTKEKLNEILIKVGIYRRYITDADKDSVLDVVAAIDSDISQAHPDDKESVAHEIATLIATYATPPETTFGVITSLMKWVFKTYVSGKYKIA